MTWRGDAELNSMAAINQTMVKMSHRVLRIDLFFEIVSRSNG